jgi:two-component system cell cycle sensor histidine kinase/response regulator CckA
VLSICRDITDVKKLETQLRQAQKMESVGTLAGGIAHDFNNILSIILGYTSLLKRGRIEPTKMAESLDAITKAAQRGSTLVRQILTFARKTEIVFESVNLNDVIGDLGKLLSETFPKTVVFKLELEDNLPSIVADANQMHQVFLNLAVNARDAMPAGGILTMHTETVRAESIAGRFSDAPPTDFVHVAVGDTGLGMDELTKSRIFEPFFTTKGQGQGTGLGLAVVYGIVNTHKGYIEVESVPGHGTTFHMYFPVQMSRFEQPLTDDANIEEAPGGTETILVAEDEKSLLDLVQGLLQSKGYRVIPATDGQQAMELYEEHRGEIALVLTDIGLPRLSGWEVCRRITQLDARTKIVVASGYLDPQAKSELGSSAARDFIHKPYLPEEVLTRIRGVLDGP